MRSTYFKDYADRFSLRRDGGLEKKFQLSYSLVLASLEAILSFA